ncbi:MAG TPA: substrate-binding domain-containing protein [Usitatibacter sp.]|jgi:molybdate transport repressor ModE-like protein|nr:substrate-binding domain-containing protein [Usitatibacter sp.]
MHKLLIKPVWVLRDHAEGDQLMHRLIPLLVGIHEMGTLAAACERTGDSYRHAWGLLQRGRQAFGAPLVIGSRGRGAKLTGLGDKLLWAEKRVAARLSPLLESVASEVEAELERASPDSRGTLRIHASHAFAITALRDFLVHRHLPVEVTYDGSSEALASFHHAACDMAGFHIPKGDLEREVLGLYAKWLKPEAHVLVQVVERRQGIIVAPGNPRGLASVADLARPHLRFVNRQPGSGTRILLDRLLAREGVKVERIQGYDRQEYTHAAVAAYIASDMADAGMGVETAARQFHLGFVPLLTERYFLVMRREARDSPMMQGVLAAMRSREFRAQLTRLQGLEATSCGTVQEIEAALPDFRTLAPPRKRREAAGS